MAETKTERKVAVILATDVVGYSGMMEENEEQTLKNLKVCRGIIEGLVNEHHGRIFNTAGDSVLAEFQSAVEAVICASEFQKTIKERNNSVGEEEQMQLRVGINFGDVVIEGDNLYGEGVNIAARLEALAQPGGICLSKNVHEIVNKKTDFQFNDLGEQKVKDTVLHAVDVVVDDSHKRTVKTKTKSKVPLYAVIVVILVLGIGGYSYYKNIIGDSQQQNKQTETSDRPTILVMPFANQSGNPEQDYIGMGMTSHLITMLSQFDQLLVLAKNTGEHILKNKIPNEEIVKQYGVQYVLNGTTQAAGKKVRVNVELANIAKNSVIWSEFYDFAEDDIFEIQDKVGDSVLGHLSFVGGARTYARKYNSSEMFKNALLSFSAFQIWSEDGYNKAKKLNDINLKIEPDNHHSINVMGWLLYQKVLLGLSQNPQEDLQKAHKLATGVLEKHPDHVLSIQLATTMEAIFGDFDAACSRLEKMIKLSRVIIEVVSTAETQRQCGDYKGSIETFEKAFEISPHFSSWIKVSYTYALMQNGDLEAAKKYALEQSTKEHGYSRGSAAFLAMMAYIYHKEGNEELAKEYFEKQKTMKNRMTKMSIETRDFSTVRSKVFVNDYVKVLQSLGMPDQ